VFFARAFEFVHDDRHHAERRQRFGHVQDVCGGKSDGSSAFVSMNDGAREGMPAAEDPAHFFEMSSSDLVANARRGPCSRVIPDEGMRACFEAEIVSEAREFVEVSGAICAEAKVFPDDHDAGAQGNQDILREFTGALRGKRAVERNDDDVASRHRLFAEANFSGEWREHWRGLSPENFCWMRVEGEDDGFESSSVGEIGSLLEYGAMSAMHSVEVADGDESARFFLFVHESIHSAYVINTAAKRKACGWPNAFETIVP
jgi:hypothetical protein